MDIEDTEACYRAVKSRDHRFDGVFYVGVLTTGIYCRPSCPAITPARKNVTFHASAAAAQAAGFRACRRCLPDATPGSPEWDVTADVSGRAMRLIADGVVEREGVDGLARRVGFTARHLNRILTGQLGAGPLALARARRAQTARILIETTAMTFADIAFAAGFASIRQFNDTIRTVYACTPSQLRGRRATAAVPVGRVELRLPARAPYSWSQLLAFLAARAVPGVEHAGPDWFERSLRLPHGVGTVRLGPVTERRGTAYVGCLLRLTDVRDVSAAVERCRRLIDADCDPTAVDEELCDDPLLAPLVRRRPGLRVPGHVDGDEVAVRTVLGQQVSVAGARTVAGRLVREYGEPLPASVGTPEVSHLFPTAGVLAGVDPARLPMPRARGRALVALCTALAAGDVVLDRSRGRDEVRDLLLDLPGIGPWTADYIAMRALGAPDVFLPTDLGVRTALRALSLEPSAAGRLGERWRPWRSYALMHLWASLAAEAVDEKLASPDAASGTAPAGAVPGEGE